MNSPNSFSRTPNRSTALRRQGTALLAIGAAALGGHQILSSDDESSASPTPNTIVQISGRAEFQGDTLSDWSARKSAETGVPAEVIRENAVEVADMNDGIATDPTDGVLTYNEEKQVGEPIAANVPIHQPDTPPSK